MLLENIIKPKKIIEVIRLTKVISARLVVNDVQVVSLVVVEKNEENWYQDNNHWTLQYLIYLIWHSKGNKLSKMSIILRKKFQSQVKKKTK